MNRTRGPIGATQGPFIATRVARRMTSAQLCVARVARRMTRVQWRVAPVARRMTRVQLCVTRVACKRSRTASRSMRVKTSRHAYEALGEGLPIHCDARPIARTGRPSARAGLPVPPSWTLIPSAPRFSEAADRPRAGRCVPREAPRGCTRRRAGPRVGIWSRELAFSTSARSGVLHPIEPPNPMRSRGSSVPHGALP